jgi:capsular polysaccharide biosynthesis protein
MLSKFNNFSNMNEIGLKKRSCLYFSTIALILSAVVFLFLLNASKKYQSRISFIFIPKSEKTALISNQIIENLVIVPKKLSFYNKLTSENEEIKESFPNFSDYQKNIEALREKDSSIVNIYVIHKDPEKSKDFARTSAFALFNVFSHYYDIKNDIDLRIIDGPNARTDYGNVLILVLTSLAIGAVLSFFINFILDSVFGYFQRKRAIIAEIPKFDFSKLRFPSVTKKTEEKETEEKKAGTQEIKNPTKQESKKPEPEEAVQPAPKNIPTSVTSEKKSSAPENLPFIDEDYFRKNIIKNGVSKEKTEEKPQEKRREASTETKGKIETPKPQEPKPSTDYKREPTQEELKKRLNKLLRGEL